MEITTLQHASEVMKTVAVSLQTIQTDYRVSVFLLVLAVVVIASGILLAGIFVLWNRKLAARYKEVAAELGISRNDVYD